MVWRAMEIVESPKADHHDEPTDPTRAEAPPAFLWSTSLARSDAPRLVRLHDVDDVGRAVVHLVPVLDGMEASDQPTATVDGEPHPVRARRE
jgi:hypothetical protein